MGEGVIGCAVFRVGDGVVFREIDGETVLLNLDTGMYYGLDQVGTRFWQLVQEHGRLEEVVPILLGEYDVTPDVLEGDLAVLVTALVAKGLLVRDDDRVAGA